MPNSGKHIVGENMASHYIDPQSIWNLFYIIYDGNEYACAGAMGNMQAESGLYSDNAENSWNSMTGHTDEWLTDGINNGTITESEFLQTAWYVNAYGFGYGLSQWTDRTRREKLWDYTIDRGLPIDSQQGQFDYITWEWTDATSHYNQFLSYMQSVTNVEDATRYYCKHYEVGAWNSDRLRYANEWYNAFAGGGGTDYYLTLSIAGNGNATVTPTRANQGDTITLYTEPNTGETLDDIIAQCITSGQIVALPVQSGYQTFTMPNDNVHIDVIFSGTSPPHPTGRTKMPIYMMIKRRL